MAKREVHYPHKIGFRVTDQTWFQIQQEIAATNLTPHDWCDLLFWTDLITSSDSPERNDTSFIRSSALNSWLAMV